MSGYEVPEPILNSPFEEPARHWNIVEGEQPEPPAGQAARHVLLSRSGRQARHVRPRDGYGHRIEAELTAFANR